MKGTFQCVKKSVEFVKEKYQQLKREENDNIKKVHFFKPILVRSLAIITSQKMKRVSKIFINQQKESGEQHVTDLKNSKDT